MPCKVVGKLSYEALTGIDLFLINLFSRFVGSAADGNCRAFQVSLKVGEDLGLLLKNS